MTTTVDPPAETLCQLCAERLASRHIGSLFPDGLNGQSYGPFKVCGVCHRSPPERLYDLARRTGDAWRLET